MTTSPEDSESNTKLYEVMVIIVPNISEEKTNKELDAIRKLIKDHKGSIAHEDIWGNRDLAYRIKKYDSGFYAVINFEAGSNLLPELDKMLKLNNNVLRHLVVKPPKDYIVKTQDQYDKEAEEMKAAEAAEKEEKRNLSKKPKKAAETKKPEAKKETPVKKEEPKEELKEEVKEEPVVVETKTAKKQQKKTIDELDEKLKSIIDDPDITL